MKNEPRAPARNGGPKYNHGVNIFELIAFTLVLWLVCLATIELAAWTALPLALVSFLVVLVVVTVAPVFARYRKRWTRRR